MAVEARHLNVLPSQLVFPTRGITNTIDGATESLYGGTMGYRLPMCGSAAAETFSLPPAAAPYASAMKAAESDLTYNLPPAAATLAAAAFSRKRPREDSSIEPFVSSFPASSSCISSTAIAPKAGGGCGAFNFLGEDISAQILQQQLEIDRFISQHMEKVRLEIEERRKRQSRRIMAAVEEAVASRLRAKEEEIEKIGKLNWALEERVRSLCVENQIWKDLAHTNEAAVNALRSNLEQVLAARCRVGPPSSAAAAAEGCPPEVAVQADDAESCCGSTAGCPDAAAEVDSAGRNKIDSANLLIGGAGRTRCRSCWKVEASVLLLPCRHLCLCTVCGSTLHTCPICHSLKNASVHVNLS